ncbi:MAG: GLPGLI family protein [Bacteroidetes bacterium]|nr:MAG: GLPGLI family protein [Bacteroidota bacterium]
MKSIHLTIIVCAIALTSGQAQQTFIAKGKIEYEKVLSLHRSFESMIDDDNDRSWIETLKKNFPATITTYFNLYFEDGKTLYKPGREVQTATPIPDWLLGPASDNVIYTDIATDQNTAMKHVFENTFLVQDSVRKIDWRITMDTRTIAGFSCRKAVGKIMDSVYVIAFYTDQILTSGGPESFAGLPGMILGVAIPRINTTWFATKLELVQVKPEDLAPPKKGKKVNTKELQEQLKGPMKDWGKWGQRNIWNIMI